MRFAAFIPMVGCILNLFLALFVFNSNRRGAANRVFLFWGLSIAVWNLGQFFLLRGDEPIMALFWARFLWFGVIFIPVLLFHISLLIAEMRVPRFILGIYAVSFALAASNFTRFFIKDIRSRGTAGFYAVAGPGLYLFMGLFGLVFATIFVLRKRRNSLPEQERPRLSALIFAQTCLVVLGTNDLLPIVGMDEYPIPHTHWTVYPYGSLAAVLYGIIVGYGVLHHQLLNIRIHVGRFAAQGIRFLFLLIIGLVILLTAALVTPQGTFNPTSFWAALITLVASGVIASVLFPRLFGAGGEVLEQRLLGDHFEYQDQMRGFIENMSWYSDMHPLLHDLHDLFVRVFQLSSYQIVLRDEITRVLTVIRSFPEQPPQALPQLKADSAVFQFFEWGKAKHLSLNPSYLRTRTPALEKAASEQLAGFNAEFCFPLATQNEPFGLLLIGPKSTHASFTAMDVSLMGALVKNLSLMVNQIRLKTQVLQAQELDLLGRMSRGMAHDLNNLLTPVWTLLQLAGETASPQVLDEELLPVALRNVRSMRAYIKESLFFSENLRPDFQLTRLDSLIENAVEVARNSRHKLVQVIASTPGEVRVEMDEILIQRLISNLIVNAIDASHEGSEVKVDLTWLPKTEVQRDWLRVRIADSGEGIRKEDLNRVFTPYFTTKNRGDETRGFGLGLAICRKIINLHGGNLSIASQHKKGTTVQVDLPSRQIVTTPAVIATAA